MLANIKFHHIIFLCRHKLTGELPLLPPNILVLQFCFVDLHGELPDQWSELKDIFYLLLDSVNVSGAIKPHVVANMTSLAKFWLRNTHLSGSIPWATGLLPLMAVNGALESLEFFGNSFLTGDLFPPEFPDGCTLTSMLVTRQRNLSGAIPASIAKCTELTELRIHDVGELKGPIPWEVCHMCKLVDFVVFRNDTNGGAFFDAFFDNCSITKHQQLCGLSNYTVEAGRVYGGLEHWGQQHIQSDGSVKHYVY